MKKRFVVKSYYTLKDTISFPTKSLDLALFEKVSNPFESEILGLDCENIIDNFPPLIKELENKKVKEAYSIKGHAGESIVIFEDNSFINIIFGSGKYIVGAQIGKVISVDDF